MVSLDKSDSPKTQTPDGRLNKTLLDTTKKESKNQQYHGIFLSHSHEDKAFAHRLKEALHQCGVEKVWLDEAEILIGDSLIGKIAEGIEKTDYFGIILSPRSVKSSWVIQKLKQAMNIQINSRRVKVLPIIYEHCEPPGFLKGKLMADFSDSVSFEAALEKLLRRLEIR